MIEFDITLHRGRFRLAAALQSDARVIGVFGPSGAGKTTLLNVLSGSVAPERGKIAIDGRCLLDTQRGIRVPIHQRRIGVVYQDGRLFPHLSVRHNLLYGSRSLRRSERRFALGQIVDLLEIGHLLDSRPGQLSGGERQRVALGRALLASPDILLLDEPMASLDERLKTQILPFLRRLKDETAVPMMYVSHSLREILELTQQLAVMHGGEIIGSGNYHDVLTSQAVLPLAQSLGIENVLPVTLVENRREQGYSLADCAGQRLVLPLVQAHPGASLLIVAPASNVALAKSTVAGISIQNQLWGTVRSIRVIGHRALVDIDIGATLLAEVTEKSIRDMDILCGQRVVCLVKAQALRYLAGAADTLPAQ